MIEAGILNGDYVVIEQKPGQVVLHPANAGMEAMAYLPDEVQVQGVLKGLLPSYR
jgi:repressor LexA